MSKETSKVDILRQTMDRATIDPDWFASEILKCPNDPWQSELQNAVADLDRIRLGIPTLYNHQGKTRFSVRSCHGTGKTHGNAKLMHWFNFTRKGRIPCTGPKERSLTTRLWPEFRKILSKASKDYQQIINVVATTITWGGNPDHCALVETATQPDNIAGYHDDNILFLIEEAAGVSQVLFPVIEGALSTENAILVMNGNPTKNTGEFYDSHNKRDSKGLYYTIHAHKGNSKRVSRKWLDDMKRKYGKDSPIYKIRCLGEFAEDGANQLYSRSWLQDAVERDLAPDGSIPFLRVSVDVADGGLDESVITVAKHYNDHEQMIKQRRFSWPSSVAVVKAATEAIKMFDEFGGDDDTDDFVADAIGVGAGTAGILLSHPRNFKVIPYKGGAASDDPTQWRNRRVQSNLACRNSHRDGHVCYNDDFYDDPLDWDDFYGQMTSIETRDGGERVEDLITKKAMKDAGIKSPDMNESITMQYATQRPTDLDESVAGSFIMAIQSRVA